MAGRLFTLSKTLTLSRANPSPAALRRPHSLPRLSLRKILGYDQNSQLSGAQGLPRFFCMRAHSGAAVHQADNTQILKNVREAAARIEEPYFLSPKNGDSSIGRKPWQK